MEKWKNILLTAIFLTASNLAIAGAYVVNCDGCSSYQYKREAEEILRFDTVIVLDFDLGNINTFNVRTEIIDDFIEDRRATLIATDSNIKSKFNAFIAKRAAFKSDLDSIKDSNGAHPIEDIIGADSNVNAIDWLADGIHSHSFYQNLKVQYPNLLDSVSFFDTFKNAVGFTYGSGSFSASVSLAALNQLLVVKFKDGTRLILEFNHTSERMTIKEAYDENGRPIPIEGVFDSVSGVYTIPNQDYYEQLTSYLNQDWLVEFQQWQNTWPTTTPRGQSCTMQCSRIADNHYECVYQCN